MALPHPPNNHDSLWVVGGRGRGGQQRSQRVESRSLQGLAGAQTETGVVPGAAHRVAHERARFQRRPEVGAPRPDGQQLVAAPHQQHRLAVGVAADWGPLGQVGENEAGCPEIGTGEGGSCIHKKGGWETERGKSAGKYRWLLAAPLGRLGAWKGAPMCQKTRPPTSSR